MKLNMEDKKNFLLVVGIALGVLLLVLGYDSSIRQVAADIRESNRNKEDELEDVKEKFLGLEEIAESRNRKLQNEYLPGMLANLQYPDLLPPAPKGEQAVHLRQELLKLQRETKNSAARKSINIPEKNWDIGDKIKQNNTPDEVKDLRLRLTATHSVIKKCIESDVATVRTIRQKMETIEAISETTKVIRRLPFEVELDGNLFSITSVLHEFQKESNFLEMIDCKVGKSSDRGNLKVSVVFAVIRVLDRSELSGVEVENINKDVGAKRTPSRGRLRRPGR